jgi:hypothetical protein
MGMPDRGHSLTPTEDVGRGFILHSTLPAQWFGHVERMEENRIPKRVLYMNLESTRARGRP